jgi:hypothetical protein
MVPGSILKFRKHVRFLSSRGEDQGAYQSDESLAPQTGDSEEIPF